MDHENSIKRKGQTMNRAKQTILVVDDDPDIILQLTALLGKDHTVQTASTAAEAEEVLLGVRPDLAIIDLMMEERDSGFVLCHNIKRLYPDTPVMMLTAVKAATGLSFTAGADEEDSWFEADLLVDKPIRPEQLCGQVRRLLAKAARAKAQKVPEEG